MVVCPAACLDLEVLVASQVAVAFSRDLVDMADKEDMAVTAVMAELVAVCVDCCAV